MPKKVDLTLPRIIVDEDYKSQGRQAEPKWMKGCYGTVRFLPWYGFQDIVRSTVDVIEQLSEAKLSNFKQAHIAAKTRIQSVNDAINTRRANAARDRAEQNSSHDGGDDNAENGSPRKFHSAYVRKFVERPSGLLKGVDNILDESILYLLRAMYSNDRVCMRSELCSSANMYANFFEDDDPLPDEFHVPLLITIQSAHIETTAENPGSVPLYSFEFTRPSVDLFGLKDALMNSGKKSEYHFLKSRETGSDSIEPALMDSIYIPGFSPQEVARYFNVLFSDVSTKDISLYRRSSLPVAKAICQALLTKTGCAFICDLSAGVAFKLEEDPKSNRLNVLVSGAIRGDEEPSYLAAMAGLAKFCVDQAEANEHRAMLTRIRRLASVVSKATLARRGIEGLLDNHHTCAAFFDEGNLVLRKKDPPPKRPTLRTTGSRKPLRWRNSNTDHKEINVLNARLHVMFTVGKRCVTTVGSDAMNWTRLISQGLWCEKDVAVKVSYDASRDSIHHIRREIKVYHLMKKKCPSLVGSAVPRMLLGKDRLHVRSPYAGLTILATEFVGKELARDTNGTLWCGDHDGYEKLDSEDEAEVRNAALESLKAIHEHGFLFGDVALRHLRADRSDAESASLWRVWWIDLGMCVEVRSEGQKALFELEWRQCVSLFHRNRATRSCVDRLMHLTFEPRRVKRRRLCEMAGFTSAQDVTSSPVSEQ